MFKKKNDNPTNQNSEILKSLASYNDTQIEQSMEKMAQRVKIKRKKRRKIRVKMILTAAVSIILTLTAVCFVLRVDITRLPQQMHIMRRMNRIDSIVSDKYIEDYDDDLAADMAAQGYISSLDDDYAVFYNEQGSEAKKKYNEGVKYGIGVDISINPDTKDITVVGVDSQGPAKKAGIKAGDIIVEYNGTSAKGKTLNDVSESIVGEEGKENKLKLKRGEKTFEINVKCGEFESDSVIYDITGDYGIIKISGFNETTYDQFMQSIKALKKLYVKGYIIDLRNNPGGLVDSCTDILDEIVPKGDIMRVQYKNGDIKVMAKSDDKYDNTPLCVLINGETASAAEQMACCIKDYDRGAIIGEKSFGKGIMQTTYPLPGSSAVKITTAKVINKSGECYHKKGIEPDIKVELSDEQNQRFYFLGDDDLQLKAAVKYLDERCGA